MMYKMQYLSVVNLVVIAFFAVVWAKTSWSNFVIKFALITLTVFNAVYVFQSFGYVVKL
jgi:hypothetical protein